MRVAVAGVEVVSGVGVDPATGTVTFDAAPLGAVTAGYEFDVPARFDSDTLQVNLASFAAGEVPSIPIVEVRL